MSRLRVSGTTVVPVGDASDAESPSAQQAQQAHHRHHHAHHVQKTNRSRTKRRRGADSQDGIDEAGASEELLMMLTEHLQKTSESVMRVGERAQQEHSGSRGGNDDGHEQDEEDAAVVRGVSGVSGKRFLRGVGSAEETETARKSAERALLDARKAQAAALPTAGSTYEPLKVMLDFLALPGGDLVSPARLSQVRERLVQAVEKPAGAAPQHQQSANLLLPLLLLNLTRRRTDDERARGTAILKSLLSRRRIAA
jgi:type III secretion regulatory protein HpaA